MKRVVVFAVIATVAFSGALPGMAYPRPGRIERVNLGPSGSEANGVTFESALSDDGRLVAFGSQATNLVPGDTNEVEDIFAHDRVTGTTERISVSSAGDQGNGTSFHAVITPDGRFIAFTSHATSLVGGDTNGVTDVFVHDRSTHTTERVSVSSAGVQTERRAFDPAISADGRYVAFVSGSTTLDPPDTNGGCDTAVEGNSQGCDVFVHDRVTRRTDRVSEGSNGEQGNGPSGWRVDMSADGRYVSFYSWATTFTPGVVGDRNGFSDIFVKDRATGNIERVSVANDGTEGNAGSTESAISADGRYVAFTSIAANLVPGDANTWNDVFVHDRLTRTVERVSVSSTGTEGTTSSDLAEISADGRYVLFSSVAPNLVASDTNGARDVFVHDRVTRTTERITVAEDGTEGDGNSSASSITRDGRLAGFGSQSSNLVPGDQNGVSDAYVRNRGPANGVGAVDAHLEGDSVEVGGWATFAGATVADASDLPSDAGPGSRELGAELTGASVVHRPEVGDVLIRASLAQMGGVPGRSRVPGVPSPGVAYVVELRSGGIRYEARASRVAATTPSATPSFGLYRCDPSCALVGPLSGGIGTTGNEVLMSIPPALVAAGPGSTLTGVRVLTGPGDSGGIQSQLDQVGLGDVTLAAPTVSLGIAPAQTAEEDVTFGTAAAVADGSFFGSLGASGLQSGGYDVWARACLGTTCGASSTRVTI